MRLWSLHPKYLDSKGIVALWREALLAQKVLRGKTKGYRHHPQLRRFQMKKNPEAAIGAYLKAVAAEARRRNYHFNESKIEALSRRVRPIEVHSGQMCYEWRHLLAKLRQRDPQRYRQALKVKYPATHPLFRIIRGKIEDWEVVKGA